MRRPFLLLLPLLGACGAQDHDPVWIHLARGYAAPPLVEVARGWPAVRADGTACRVVEDQDGVWIETTLGPAAWRGEDGRPGAWSAERPWDAAFACAGNGRTQLVVDGAAFREGSGREQDARGLYYLDERRVYVAVEPGSGPPKATVYRLSAAHGTLENGAWRVRTLDHVGEGIGVWNQQGVELEVDVPEGAVLSFTTVFEQLPHGLDEDQGSGKPTARFRVSVDGAVAWEAAGLGHAETHRLPLAAGRRRVHFEVDGPAGRGVFYAPVVGPGQVGDYTDRPWPVDRPNLVLFIADTFRADNLAMYGGPEALSPRLNAFAAESLGFRESRSTAAWTLPSISSILTGLFPPQHGATQEDKSISRDLTTVAETLGRFGYRTVAVTDSGFFSPPFGLDQGFELFYENRIHHWNMHETVRQALQAVDHDDGRPLFLVVHTYRAHGPLRTGEDEDLTAFEEFVAKGAELMAHKENRLLATRKQTLLPYLEEWVALYEAGVLDLDYKFGLLLDGLRARGVLERGYLIFCGDHGQAHGENQDVAHGGKLWESKLRIPMLLHGHDVTPGESDTLVSLIDLAPTLGALAGVPREEDWVGTSLLALTAGTDRPTFAFRLEGEGEEEVTIHRGGHKVCALPDPAALRRGEVREAYDVARDPWEERDLAAEAEWDDELAREMADVVELFLRAKAEADAEMDAALKRQLADIGYTGE